jgi:hypothetical protein
VSLRFIVQRKPDFYGDHIPYAQNYALFDFVEYLKKPAWLLKQVSDILK